MNLKPDNNKTKLQDDTSLDDYVLAEQAAAGDKLAFESIYRRHVSRVYGLSLRLTADTNEAEILTQDTFVKAWLAINSFSGRGELGAWLSRIAVNLYRDRYRSRIRNEKTLEIVATEPGYSGKAFGIERNTGNGNSGAQGSIVSLLTGMDLERCIAQLPLGARTAFVLHQVEGYPHHEIAAMMDIATGTVKAQVHRAKRLLRVMLTDRKEATNGA